MQCPKMGSGYETIVGQPRLLLGSRTHEERRSHYPCAFAARRQHQPESARRAVDIALAWAWALPIASVSSPRHRPQHGAGCERYAGRQRRDRAAILDEVELVKHGLPAGGSLLLDPALPFERRPGRRRRLDRKSAGLRKIAHLRDGGFQSCRMAQCYGDHRGTGNHTRTSKSFHTLLSRRPGFPTGSAPASARSSKNSSNGGNFRRGRALTIRHKTETRVVPHE